MNSIKWMKKWEENLRRGNNFVWENQPKELNRSVNMSNISKYSLVTMNERD